MKARLDEVMEKGARSVRLKETAGLHGKRWKKSDRAGTSCAERV